MHLPLHHPPSYQRKKGTSGKPTGQTLGSWLMSPVHMLATRPRRCTRRHSRSCSNGRLPSPGPAVFGFIGPSVRAGRLVGEANPALRGRRHSCRFPHRNVLCGIGGGGSCHPGLLSPVVNMSLTGTNPVVVHSGESTDRGKPLKSTLGGHPRPRAFFSLSISANLPTCSPCPPRVGSGRDRIRRSLTGGEPIHPAD